MHCVFIIGCVSGSDFSVGQGGALDGDGAGGGEVRGDVGELGGMIAQGGRGGVTVAIGGIVEVEVYACDLRGGAYAAVKLDDFLGCARQDFNAYGAG